MRLENKNWFKFLVLILGMVVVSNLSAQTDSRLNGTWARLLSDGRSLGGHEYTFNNGTFEVAFLNALGRTVQTKGIYIINGDSITMAVTHMNVELLGFGESGVFLTLEEAWHGFNDFHANSPQYHEFNVNPWAMQETLISIFSIRIRNFVVSGNRLNLSGADMPLTRR